MNEYIQTSPGIYEVIPTDVEILCKQIKFLEEIKIIFEKYQYGLSSYSNVSNGYFITTVSSSLEKADKLIEELKLKYDALKNREIEE